MKTLKFFLSILPLLVLTPMLTSCGGPATSNAQLSVSHSFIAGASATGGFIVMGESATKKFVMSLTGTTEGKVKLDKGVWKFTAIGWDGALPFEGNTLCGSVPSVDLSADTANVEISVTAASCSNSALTSELNVRALSTIACDIFYQYNQGSNSFTALSSSFSPSFCGASMPNDYRSEFGQFRYQSMNINNGQEAPGFISSCKDLTVPTSLNLPTNKIPFLVKFYKNADDCTNNRGAQNYFFKDGISLGSPNFDHKLNTSGTMLLLSSAKTKRGMSPFMNEIPRITCGTNGSMTDCFTEPVLPAHVNVPFGSNHYGDQVVLKGVNPQINVCTPAIMSSKFFTTETCEVDEGMVRIKPQRNELICQANPFFQGGFTIKDMRTRGNKVYILRRDTGLFKDLVTVYTKKGKKLAEYDLGAVELSQIAVNADGTRFVGISTSQVHTFSVSGNTVTPGTHNLSGVTNIELNPLGTYFYAGYSGYLKSYNFDTGTMKTSQMLPGPVSQMTSNLTNIYVVISGSNNIHGTTFLADGTISSDVAVSIGSLPSDIQAMTVSEAGKVYYHDGVGAFRASNGLPAFSASVDVSAYSTSPMAMTYIDDLLYLANSSTVYAVNPVSGLPVSANTGNCAETLTFTLGTATKTLSFTSHQNQPLQALYSEGYNLIGRTYFNDTEKPFYYFQSLSHNEDGIRTGGKLERIQEMLGPEALGGFLSQYATCNDVIAAAPFTRNHTFIDESKAEVMDFTLSVATTSTEYMNSYICDDADSSGASCTPSPSQAYDLILNFSHNGTDHREKMRIKLKCGAKKGSFESADVEYSPSSIRNELLLWNTNTPEKSRFERYSLDQETKKRAEIVRLEKSTANTLAARSIDVELNGSTKSGSVSEFEITTNDFFTGRYSVSDTLANFNAGSSAPLSGHSYSFNDIVDNETFNGSLFPEAPAFTQRTNTNINGTTSVGGYFSPIAVTTVSKGIFLSISDLNIDNSSHPLVLAPGAPGAIFELNP